MKWAENRESGRLGFSLIELLVVIFIIAVLVAMITPAIFSVLVKGPQVTTVQEIGQLEMGVQAFKGAYNVKHIPSLIKLGEKLADYGLPATYTHLDKDSIAYLSTLWPKIMSTWQAGGVIDWNGDGVHSPAVVLEGDQCLVFFLGGIPVGTPDGSTIGARSGPPGCYGFAPDQKDPVKLPQVSGRKGPFFEFKGARLRDRTGKGFWSYYDLYGSNDSMDKPYAYFSNYHTKPGYNKYRDLGISPGGDCPSIHQPVSGPIPGLVPLFPYQESPTPPRYYNPEGFQIICAGADRVFGPGALWPPPDPTSIGTNYRDDQTNFHGKLMGVN